MNSTLLQDYIVRQLQGLDKKEPAYRSLPATLEKGDTIRLRLQRQIRKYRDSTKAFSFMATFSLLFLILVLLAILSGYRVTPDPRSGILFLFLTLCQLCTAFYHRLRLKQYEQQRVLLDLLCNLRKEEEKNKETTLNPTFHLSNKSSEL